MIGGSMGSIVQNEGRFGDLACDCGSSQHEHYECRCGMECRKCGITTYYNDARPQFVAEGDGVSIIYICRYCRSSDYLIWDNLAAANEMYPHGCTCENNGDYCNYCEILLTPQD